MSVWKTIPSSPHYEASDCGKIRRAVDGINTYAGRVLQSVFVRGYLVVGIRCADGKWRQRKVHSLVCEAFHGPKPSLAYQVAHGDGLKTNNAASNLRWATSKQNHADRVGHGTAPRGTLNGRAKLNENQVKEIRSARLDRKNITIRFFAEKYGVSTSTISEIRRPNAGLWKSAA